jgi:hypothetical protein
MFFLDEHPQQHRRVRLLGQMPRVGDWQEAAELGRCPPWRRAGLVPAVYRTFEAIDLWSSAAPKRGKTSRSGRLLNILEKSRFRERHAPVAADDEVIKHPDIHQRQGVPEAGGNEFVGVAGFGDPRRML